jgi:hypothetical protein
MLIITEMSTQEFYEAWKSKILLIPDLPLEKDTAATNEESMAGTNNMNATNWSFLDKKVHPYEQIDSIRHSRTNLEAPGRLSRGLVSASPREESLAESIVEEHEIIVRDKLRSAFRDENLKDQKLGHQLGVKTTQEFRDGAIGTTSEQLTSSEGVFQNYQLFKVSDIFKSAFIGNKDDRKKAIATLFKYRRGASVINPSQCRLYTPNEGKSIYQEPVEYLKCVNCGKSMNSHLFLKFKTAINDRALEYMKGMRYYEEMLMDKDIVVLIGTGLNQGSFSSSNTESTLSMFLQQLSTCGLKVKDIVKMNDTKMKTQLYWKYLVLNCPLEEKDTFEDYINHPEIPDSQFSKVRISQVVNFYFRLFVIFLIIPRSGRMRLPLSIYERYSL